MFYLTETLQPDLGILNSWAIKKWLSTFWATLYILFRYFWVTGIL